MLGESNVGGFGKLAKKAANLHVDAIQLCATVVGASCKIWHRVTQFDNFDSPETLLPLSD